MKTTTEYKLVAVKRINGEEIVMYETVASFKALSKRHHALSRQGWRVSLPL